MRPYRLLAALALAAPAIAPAQVGPNPAVNGSLDPSVGKGTDTATAPDDVAVGVDASASTMTLPGGDTAADNATAATDATVTANATTPLSPSAAATKKTTAPTSESARKPR